MQEELDTILIKKAKSGDISAFKSLIKKYEKKVFNSAMWLINNKDDAMDIVQEVFLNAFKNINKFREESSFYTWLYWILLDMVKRKRIKNKFYEKIIKPIFKSNDDNYNDETNDVDNLTIKNMPNDDPANILIKKEHSKSIIDTINSLDIKYKIPILLCDLDKLSYKEAAKILKYSETTLKIRLFRARLKLKEKLKYKKIYI